LAQTKKSNSNRKQSGSGKEKKAAGKAAGYAASGRSGSTSGNRSGGRPASAAKHPAGKKSGNDTGKILGYISCSLITVILFLALIGKAGKFGAVLKNVQLGLFGTGGYAFPLLFLYCSIYFIKKWADYHWAVVIRFLELALIYLSCTGIFALLAGMSEFEYVFKTAYEAGGEAFGGGAVGGFFANLLFAPLGALGAYAVLVAVLIFGILLITGAALWRSIADGGKRAARNAKDGYSRFKEDEVYRRRQAEEQQRKNAVEKEAMRVERQRKKQEKHGAKRVSGMDFSAMDLKGAETASAGAAFAANDGKPIIKEQNSGVVISPDLRAAEQNAVGVTTSEQKPAGINLREQNPAGAGTAERNPAGINLREQNPAGINLQEKNPAGADAAERNASGINAAAKKPVGDNAAEQDIPIRGAYVLPRDSRTLSELDADYAAGGKGMPEEIRIDRLDIRMPKEILPEDTVSENRIPENMLPEDMIPEDMPLADMPSEDMLSANMLPEIVLENTLPEEAGAAPVRSGFMTASPLIRETISELPDDFQSTNPWPEEGFRYGGGLQESYEAAETYSEDIEQNGASEDADPMAALEQLHRPLDRTASREGSEGGISYTNRQNASDRRQASGEIEKNTQRAGTSGTGISSMTQKPKKPYVLPNLNLLQKAKNNKNQDPRYLKEVAARLEQTLRDFGVNVEVIGVSCGPTVTRYELKPEQGVKVSRIVGLSNDIKLSLAASDIRIEAPIPGKSAVGIEVPNPESQTVTLRTLLESEAFQKHPSRLAFGVGLDLGGEIKIGDLAKMPHMLIAGATGSGKSVCINTLIMSILFKAKPEEVKLIMIDPKVVELSVYNGIPHLMVPVITDPQKAIAALNSGIAEMTRRYQLFARENVRDLKGYNKKLQENPDEMMGDEREILPQIVIIIDEMADLMMVAKGDVENAVCRLAQLARAAGIHLVLATQRPSVDVITGLIKANIPSRIAFSVSSGVDSRTIIDMVGAEHLLGKGDMLYYPSGMPKPERLQGAFVSDEEVAKVVEFVKAQADRVEQTEVENAFTMPAAPEGDSGLDSARDELFIDCGNYIIEAEKASIGNLQRRFRIGFNRAARIMDQLAEAGVVGPENSTKSREILMTPVQFMEYVSTHGR